jgi:hypothetical protein
MMDATSTTANDVADEWRDGEGRHRRVRLWNTDDDFDETIKGMRWQAERK